MNKNGVFRDWRDDSVGSGRKWRAMWVFRSPLGIGFACQGTLGSLYKCINFHSFPVSSSPPGILVHMRCLLRDLHSSPLSFSSCPLIETGQAQGVGQASHDTLNMLSAQIESPRLSFCDLSAELSHGKEVAIGKWEYKLTEPCLQSGVLEGNCLHIDGKPTKGPPYVHTTNTNEACVWHLSPPRVWNLTQAYETSPKQHERWVSNIGP